MTNSTNDFSNVMKDELILSVLLTINNLYEILEKCDSEKQSHQVSSCIYLLETSLYAESSQNPFVKI